MGIIKLGPGKMGSLINNKTFEPGGGAICGQFGGFYSGFTRCGHGGRGRHRTGCKPGRKSFADWQKGAGDGLVGWAFGCFHRFCGGADLGW